MRSAVTPFDSDPIFSRLLAGDEEKGFADVVLNAAGRVGAFTTVNVLGTLAVLTGTASLGHFSLSGLGAGWLAASTLFVVRVPSVRAFVWDETAPESAPVSAPA